MLRKVLKNSLRIIGRIRSTRSLSGIKTRSMMSLIMKRKRSLKMIWTNALMTRQKYCHQLILITLQTWLLLTGACLLTISMVL